MGGPMAKPIGFSAFLKLLQLSDVRRKAELRKKQGSGKGYQYWRPLQIVAPKAILKGASIVSLITEIESLCSGYQQKYNKDAFATFGKWIDGKLIEPMASLPQIDVEFGNSGLTIRLRPDVSFKLDGAPCSMNIWATTTPLLTEETLSAGLLFLSSAYKSKDYGTPKFLVFDAVSNRVSQESDILPIAAKFLESKAAAFKRDWDSLNPTSPSSPTPPRHDQPSLIKR